MNSEFMKRAIELAEISASSGEVPVGAVIVKDGKIIAEGRNRREENKNALCHAEIEAINGACRALGDWRLGGCELYVTLEPCCMCAGAIVNARISTLIFGAYDLNAGCADSVYNLCDGSLGNRTQVFSGIMEAECSKLLTDFFKGKRDFKPKNPPR